MSGRPPGPPAGEPGQGSAREIEVEWRAGRRVTARWEGPVGEGRVGILLAHGAGAGQDHPFVAGLRRRLAAAGHPTMTFDYPYVAEGWRAPDRLDALLACHRAAADALAGRVGPVALAGKSMGGRVAAHLASGGYPCRALVCYGYPLLPPGGAAVRETGYLGSVGAPILFLAGSRDPLAPPALLRPVVERLPRAALRVMEGGNHSFGVRGTMDDRGEEALDLLARWTVEWLALEEGRAGDEAGGRPSGQGRLPAR